MKDKQTMQADFEALCLHQKETITRQEVRIWDLEEEIRVLNRQIQTMEEAADKAQEKIDKFELWCDHQQTLINTMDIEKLKTQETLTYFQKHSQELESYVHSQEEACRILSERCRTLEADYRTLEENHRTLEANYRAMEKGTLYQLLRKIKHTLFK